MNEANSISRKAERARQTKETKVEVRLDLDGTGQVEVQTGLGFLDHMIHSLAFHARLDLRLQCDGDLDVDDHHTVEDCALTLGAAIDEALGAREGVVRFGSAYAPLDEALARAVIDLSQRPSAHVELGLRRPTIGNVACENLAHFLRSLAQTSGSTLHVDVLRGENDHHRVEAAFKATALAFRQAKRVETGPSIASTKGILG